MKKFRRLNAVNDLILSKLRGALAGCNVTLLASDSASFITGAILSVDGGLTA